MNIIRRLRSLNPAIVEAALVVIGVACLGTYAFATLERVAYQRPYQPSLAKTIATAFMTPEPAPRTDTVRRSASMRATGPATATATSDFTTAANSGKPKISTQGRKALAGLRLRPGSIGVIEIPRLRLSAAVVEGDDDRALEVGAGHLPDTPQPWERGNSAIAAHRDTLFRRLRKIKVGDNIRMITPHGELRYRVKETRVVTPDDLSVLAQTASPMLTLITCYPFNYIGSAPKRFIVHADRVDQ